MSRSHQYRFADYFDDLRPRTFASGIVSEVRKEDLICRIVELLQDSRITQDEHNWWCDVLECIGKNVDIYAWNVVQRFFFALLKGIRRKEIFVGDDIMQFSESFFAKFQENHHYKDNPQFSVRIGAEERANSVRVTKTVYFCRQYNLTGKCNLGSDCVLEHSCPTCLKNTGKRFLHTLHECEQLAG